MKKIYLLLALLMSLNFLSAQNWQTITSGHKSYYKGDAYKLVNNDHWNINGVRIDSVLFIAGDSILYNFLSFHDTNVFFTSPCLAIKDNSWIGQSMRKTSNGLNIFHNKMLEPIIINTLAFQGSTWPLYNYPNGSLIKGTVDSVYFGNVNSIADSIKVISLQYIDSLGSPAPHVLNSKRFTLSLSNGIVDLFDMNDFPADSIQYSLSSLSPLSNYDLYNYNIGDVFGYNYRHYNEPPGSWRRKTITAKYLSPSNDSVYYEYSLIDRHFFVNYSGGTPFMDSTTSVYTNSESHSDLDSLVFKEMSREALDQPSTSSTYALHNYNFHADSSVFGGLRTYTTAGAKYSWNGSCYEQAGMGGNSEVEMYVEGCGMYRQSILDLSAGPTSATFDQVDLIYIDKGSFTWGHWPYLFDATSVTEREMDTDLYVYPNPASDLVYIKMKPSNEYSDLIIFDVSGRVMTKFVLNGSVEGNFHLDTKQLANGIYFFQINNSYKKIVIQNSK
jgi:hypothetical protein